MRATNLLAERARLGRVSGDTAEVEEPRQRAAYQNTMTCSRGPGMNTFIVREPRAQTVDFGADTLVVHLEDGRSISAPLEWFPRLRDASDADRQRWRLIGRGVGIHWEAVDEDLSVRGLLEGAAAVKTRRAS